MCRHHNSQWPASEHHCKTASMVGKPDLCMFNTFAQHLSPPSPPPTPAPNLLSGRHSCHLTVSGLCLLEPSTHPWPQPPVALVSLDFGYYKLDVLSLFLWNSIYNRALLPDLDTRPQLSSPTSPSVWGAAGHLWTSVEAWHSTQNSIGQTQAACQQAGSCGLSSHARVSSSAANGH